MLPLRTLARSVPRSVSRPLCRSSTLRTQLTTPKSSFVQPWKQATKSAYAAFSTSSAFRQPTTDGDTELVAKLEDELKHEQASQLEQLSSSVENVQSVLGASDWEVKDVPNELEVMMSKKFGNEQIRLYFSVADIRAFNEQEVEFDDNALSDEDYEGHQPINQGRGNAGGASSQHPEDSLAPADREMDGMGEGAESFPVHVSVIIEKPGGGALRIQTEVANGSFQIEELSHFAKSDLAVAQTAEKDWTRLNQYSGPPFRDLDQDVQSFLERYLEERGINSELALMIPDYIQVKEQKEYIRWLETVKNFVAA